MVSIVVFRRKRTSKTGKETTDKAYSAQIRFGRDGAKLLRSTGKTTEREALAEARRIARDYQENEAPRKGKDILTVERMFARWIEEKGKSLRSKKDISWQLKRLADGIGLQTEVAAIGNKTIHGFVQDSKAGGASGIVINRCLETLRSIMRYAGIKWEAEIKMIDWGAHLEAKKKERQIYLSPEEAMRLIAELPEHVAQVVAWSLYTGCRLNETETLIWERIDLKRRLALVETKERGTEPVYRQVWLSEKALRVLEAIRPKSNGVVFNVKNRRKHWEAARAAIGREDFHFHDLRAMTATWSRQFAGSDLKLIGRALGHSNEVTTSRYAHVIDSEVMAMLEKLPDVDFDVVRGPLPALQSNVASHKATIREISVVGITISE